MNNYDDMNQKSNMIIYTTEDGLTKIETTFDEDTVWLSIDQMAELFQRDKSTISRHIKNVFSEGELQRESVVANFATTAADGKTYQVDYYNLDVIISVGYRVKSKRGTQFRIWATNILKEYMKKGFALDSRNSQSGYGRPSMCPHGFRALRRFHLHNLHGFRQDQLAIHTLLTDKSDQTIGSIFRATMLSKPPSGL